jgi:hypothetical protein
MEKWYEIAGHRFCVAFEGSRSLAMRQYAPFALEDPSSAPDAPAPLFRLVVAAHPAALPEEARLIYSFEEELPFVYAYRAGEDLWFRFLPAPERESALLCVSGGKDPILYPVEGVRAQDAQFAVNNAAMMLFAALSAPFGTLMMHASVIRHAGLGHLFLGKSGTGKSTHSRMWLEAIPDSELLNDDTPILRAGEGGVRVYGSPWSGKTPCYRNLSVPACSIVRIVRAPENRIRRHKGLDAYAVVLPSCARYPWFPAMAGQVSETLQQILGRVGIWSLECRPDHDAARVCQAAVEG